MLHSLGAERPKLAAALSILTQHSAQASGGWDDTVINVMDTRLNALLALSITANEGEGSPAPSTDPMEMIELPPGWRKLTERDGWRPVPMGIYVACS